MKGIQHFRSRPDLRPPEILIDVPAKDVIPGLIFTECHGGVTQQGPMILSETGRLIGFQPVSATPTPARRAFNVRVQTYQGKPVMTYFVGAVVSAHGQGHYLIYDENYHQVAQVHAGNGYQGDLHEFLLTDQGTALFTAYGEAVGTYPSGSRGKYFYGIVQEVDVASGKVLFQWRSDQHVPLADSYVPAPLNPANTWDYFHVNAITIDPTDNNLVISSRNTSTAYKVDRKTGRVIWKLGGKHSDFHMGPGSRFYFQHDVNLYPGGVVTIFDNEAGPPNMAKQSRGLVLQIDETKKTASRAHAVAPQAAGPVKRARQRPAARQGPHVHGLGHLELLHRVRARADGPVRRPPDPGNGLAIARSRKPGPERRRPSPAWRRREPARPPRCTPVGTSPPKWPAGSCSPVTMPTISMPSGWPRSPASRPRSRSRKARKYVAVEAIDGTGAVLGKSKPLKLSPAA